MTTLTYLTTTHFDFGALAQLPSELEKAGISKPFVATDAGLVADGLVETVTNAFGKGMECSVYDGTPCNPTEEAVKEALSQYQAQGCDGVIALWGRFFHGPW